MLRLTGMMVQIYIALSLLGSGTAHGYSGSTVQIMATPDTFVSNAMKRSETDNMLEVAPAPIGTLEIFIDAKRRRLLLYLNDNVYKTYPIAIGKPETPSPTGDWVVTTRGEDWGSGFGTRWIGLNVPWGIYGIHGTNRPASIGRYASHGCIRMRNRDVEELYQWIKLGTKVHISGHVLGNAYALTRPLATGDVGADVMVLQDRLRSGGYFRAARNGKFGPSTAAALRQYEKRHLLRVDGVLSLTDAQALGLDE